MSIYISGSMAYDRLMIFPGKFTDSILPDQLAELNVSFCVNKFEEKLGGNAGNIAYSLALLGEKPIIVATVGNDFEMYERSLRDLQLSLEGLTYVATERTAGAYINTDLANNQITAFHPAAMLTPSTYTFPHIDPAQDIAIVCPTNPTDMCEHPRMHREKGVRYIYDPSQQVPILSKEDLLDALQGAYLLIGNIYEIKLIMQKTGKSKTELLSMTQAGLVTTLSEEGSIVTAKDGTETAIKAVSVNTIGDPTGAGDAFRAGFIKGLTQGRPLPECAQMGSTCAAFCLEAKGPQEHTFTMDQFINRYNATYGSGQ